MINIFGLNIHFYGLILGTSIWLAWEGTLLVAKKRNIGVDVINKLAGWVIVGGLIGARAYHVIDWWERYYRFDPIKILYVWEGGLGIWGAIIGGVVFLLLHRYIFSDLYKDNRVSILSITDCVGVVMPLAQALGRTGNWVNGELLGKNGEPLFLYESLLNLSLFIILWRMSKHKLRVGQLTGVYLIGYGLIRLFLENLRSDQEIWRVFSMPVAGMIGFTAVVIGAYIYRFPLGAIEVEG